MRNPCSIVARRGVETTTVEAAGCRSGLLLTLSAIMEALLEDHFMSVDDLLFAVSIAVKPVDESFD